MSEANQFISVPNINGLVCRITEYLQLGGLFNPEMMDHDKVRDLLVDCRECLEQIQGFDKQRGGFIVSDSKQADLAKLDKCMQELREHFDSVQIFATRYEGGDIGTVTASRGESDWFARYGVVRNWLLKQEAVIDAEAREDE